MYRFYLALRYLLSRPINLLGMMGVAVSVAALIVVVSVFSGFLLEVQKHVRSVTSDLTVLGCERLDEVENVLRSDANVAAYAPRMVWFGLLHAMQQRIAVAPTVDPVSEPGAESPLISLFGIDPERERRVTDFDAWIRAVEDPALRLTGEVLPAPGDSPLPAVLLGEKRMQLEGLRAGTIVKVTSARPAPSDSRDPLDLLPATFTVQGAYATRHTAFDARSCFVHIDTLRGMMGAGASADAVTQVAVRCKDPALRLETAARLERQINEARPFAPNRILVRAWDEIEGHFLSAVDHQRSLMKLVMIVILVVAAFLMYATLSMMVTEKTYDIGILTAMGATRLGVMQVFLSCGMAITLAGTALGIALGCAGSIYLDNLNRWLRAAFDLDLFPTRIYNLDRVPYFLDWLWIAQVTGMALMVGLLVSGLPAWRAARHDPLHSLRYE